jgi:hypothetical protein
MEQFTYQFTETLTKMDLIQPLNLNVKLEGKQQNIEGCFGIDEKKLHELNDENFLSLRDQKFFGPIYAQLHSVAQIERLIILHSSQKT